MPYPLPFPFIPPSRPETRPQFHRLAVLSTPSTWFSQTQTILGFRMNTDGQQDHSVQLVKLSQAQVDHFLLGAEDNRIVTPPHTPPTYTHIHGDMVGSHYLSPSPHHTDRLQSDRLRDSTTSCSSGPSTGAYTTPELDPYSAVRPQEAHCLPTFATLGGTVTHRAYRHRVFPPSTIPRPQTHLY